MSFYSKKVLQFKTEASAHPGLNVTVRKGHKWHASTEPGERLLLAETGHEDKPFGEASVVFAVVTSFELIPDEWLRFEHAIGARTRDGLKREMDAAYGADSWEDVLTVLFFWV